MLWFFIGMIIGALLLWLISNVRDDKLKVQWYQWVLGLFAVILALSTLQNYLSFQAGLEPIAAKYVLLFQGLPALALALLAWLIPVVLTFANSKKQKIASS